ncbi:hypothetical protein BEK98_20150 [Streptomyces diastatochromogenes]|uniref:Uncharacterized protein n=2 Tax=Streptomyces diastatochromogenes TaxID=42236 RepID=A0A233SEV5_STRDA|nr:hypothetical protein BEK98_20150 [Streptomyces diastatochromogenes]
MIAGLVAASAVLICLGRQDIIHALSYAGRLAGGLLVAAGLVALAAAVCAVMDRLLGRGTKYTTAITLFGALAVLGVGLLLLTVQIGEYTLWLWLWLGLIVWACWALWDLLHRRQAWREITFRRNFAAVVSFTALITAANFVYSQIYEPYSSPMTVTTSVKIGSIRKDEATTYVPVTFQMENTGKVAAYVVGMGYSLTGLDWKSTYQKPRDLKQWEKDIDTDALTDLHAYADKPHPYTVSIGLLEKLGDFELNPGEKYTQEKTIELPTQTFRAVQVQSEAYLLRKDRMIYSATPTTYYSWSGKREKIPKWVTDYAGADADSDYVRYQVPVRYSNQILNFTRRPRRITLWWLLGKENSTPITTLVASLDTPGGEQTEPTYSEGEQEREKYGFTYLNSGSTEAIL